MIQNYKDLQVWQKAILLVKEIYLLSQKIPKEEIYGLISQMRRCAVSIPSNIAEGFGRNTQKEFLQFLFIAKGSASELETQLILTSDLYSLDIIKVQDLNQEVLKMLTMFIKKIKDKV